MWANCVITASLNMARRGSTSTTFPSTIRKPVGSFIQALTLRMQKVPITPAAAMGTSMR